MRVGALAVLLCAAAVCSVFGYDANQIEVKFGNRNFYVVHPEYPTNPKPGLIVWYHGYGQWCLAQNEWCDKWQANLKKIGLNFMCVSICGENGGWDTNGNKDIDLTKQIIDYMAKNYNVDTSKVFASGWSYGGMFSAHLACRTGTSIVQGISPHCCAGQCNAAPIHYLGYQAMYDNVCAGSVSGSWESFVRAQGCGVGSGNDRRVVCKGKQYELHFRPAGHSIMDYTQEGPAWIARALGSTPTPTPSTGNCGATSAEGETLTLSCEAGQNIASVQFASYGTPTGDCSAGFAKSTCDAANSTAVVAAKCIGQNKCAVVAGNEVFGDPCPTVQKHLSAKVTCLGRCGSTATEGESLTLACPAGQIIGSIDFASYGTPAGDCTAGFTKGTCDSTSSVSVMNTACVGKNSCTVAGSNANFGDPCSGTNKRLAAKATCIAPLSADVTCGTAGENSNLVLGCVGERKITAVTFASYGLPLGSCPDVKVNSTCNASSSQAKVEAACVGKSFCSVPATNELFADPCSGLIKKLSAAITCA